MSGYEDYEMTQLFYHKDEVDDMLSAKEKVIYTITGVAIGFFLFFVFSLGVAHFLGLE